MTHDAFDARRMAAPPLVPEIALHLRPELALGSVEPESSEPAYWREPWPAGQALARFVLDTSEVVRAKRVVDVGTGCGVVALAAKHAGAERVLGIDKDPYALRVLGLNASTAGLPIDVVCRDCITHNDKLEGFDVILAADVLYEPHAAALAWRWFSARACAGARVILSDPGRPYLPSTGLVELARYEIRPTAVAIYQIDPVRAVTRRGGA